MYAFKGSHYLSSFTGCHEGNLKQVETLKETVKQAIIQCGATILQESIHVFDNQACTMVFLLSESHCSIHTYVEHQSVFMDLFTCGDTCDYSIFEELMKAYLQPNHIVKNIVSRSDVHQFK